MKIPDKCERIDKFTILVDAICDGFINEKVKYKGETALHKQLWQGQKLKGSSIFSIGTLTNLRRETAF